MNKKLILILICLTAFGTAFAQTDFTPSAKSKATSGTITSDSDNVNANDIFDVGRTFFSAGYQPALTLGNGNSFGKMSGFWAMPINDIMTVGIAGEYKMFADRAETSVLNGANGVNSSITLNENSAFNIRPVFKFGAFAFSYRIARNNNYNSVEKKTTLIPSGTDVYTNKTSGSGTKWEHEIGFAWKTDMFKLYVPIGALINMNTSINEAENNSINAPATTIDKLNKTDNKVVSLYINPEISFPVEIGPITQFQTGINFTIGILAPRSTDNLTTYSGTDYESSTTPNTSIKEDKYIIKTEGQSSIAVGTFLQTTMEWKTWEDKITFIAEPEIGIDYTHRNRGYQTTTITETPVDGDAVETVINPTVSGYMDTVTPYLEANIGSTIKFTEWFELRAGLLYKFIWENTISTQSYELQEGGKLSKYGYDFKSEFEVYSGVGFILGEDFFIDIYIAAGNFIDNSGSNNFPVDPATTTQFSLFDIRNYGVQLSYRF